jgi:hypothetical protein
MMRGFAGAFVLQSRRTGFLGALGWVPDGMRPPREPGQAQDRGHLGSEEKRQRHRYATARHELVSLWETKEDARLGGERMTMSFRRALGPILNRCGQSPYVELAEVRVATFASKRYSRSNGGFSGESQ